MTHLASGYSDRHTAFHIRMLFWERYYTREPPRGAPSQAPHPREPRRRDGGEPLHPTGQPCGKAALLKAFPGLLSPPVGSKPFGDLGLL